MSIIDHTDPTTGANTYQVGSSFIPQTEENRDYQWLQQEMQAGQPVEKATTPEIDWLLQRLDNDPLIRVLVEVFGAEMGKSPVAIRRAVLQKISAGVKE